VEQKALIQFDLQEISQEGACLRKTIQGMSDIEGKMTLRDVWRPLHCLNRLFHPSTGIDRRLAEALHKLGDTRKSGAAFVRPSALT
jgi:hypothetical protein